MNEQELIGNTGKKGYEVPPSVTKEEDIKKQTISSSSDEENSDVDIKQSPGTIHSPSAKKDNASSRVAIKRSVKKVGSISKGGGDSVAKGSIREQKWGSGKGGWATTWEEAQRMRPKPGSGGTWAERLKPRYGPNGSIAKERRAREKKAKEQWARQKMAIIKMVMGDSKGADMMGDSKGADMLYGSQKLYLHKNGHISTKPNY